MRIAFLLPNFLPYASGNGASVMTWAFCAELRRQGHEVEVIRYGASKGGWTWTEDARGPLERLGVTIKDVPRSSPTPKRGVARLLGALRRAARPRLTDIYPARTSPGAIQEALRSAAVDLVYSFEMDAMVRVTGFNPGIPVLASIIDLPDEWLKHRRRYKPPPARFGFPQRLIRRLAERRTFAHTVERLKRCSGVIEHAAHHARRLGESGVRCTYLPNPVEDPQLVAPFGERESMPREGPVRVAMFGNLRGLATISGLEAFVRTLLPALESEEQFAFHVMGGGEPPTQIRAALHADPRVHVRGFVEDIHAEFRAAQIVLVPTPIDLGFRTRIAESFGFGAVVVAHTANARGMPELEHEGNCLLYDSPATWRESMRRASEDRDLARRLSEGARRCFVEHYTAPRVAGRMIERAAQLVADYRPRRT